MAEELKPDVLVMAIGAKAFIPPIPGIDGKNVVPAVGMHENHAAIGNRVVVIGGGLIGCEEALELAKNGHEVTVLEMREDVAIDSAYLHREALLLELEKQKEHVKLFCNMSCSEIRENGGGNGKIPVLRSRFPGDWRLLQAGESTGSCKNGI